jgi:hypothetical protein
MSLQIRRGTDAERTGMSVPLAPGELLYTTDSRKIYVGNGTTIGGLLVSGFNANDSKDAAAEMIINGSHQRISFSYDNVSKTLNAIVDTTLDDGPLTADAFVGSVFADDSTLLVDAINGRIVGPVFANVTGNVTGNLEGSVTGELVGSVFADNSTLLVDAVDGRIVGPVFANVTGSVFATNSNLLVDATAGEIVGPVNNIFVTTSDLSVNTITTTFNTSNQIIFNQQDLTANSIEVNKYSNDNTHASGIAFLRSRGDENTQTSVAFGDKLASLNFKAFDGTSFIDTVSLSAEVTGSVSTGVVPTSIIFRSAGSETARIDSDGILRMNRNGSQDVFTAFQSAHNSSSDSASFRFIRSRNNVLSPSSVAEGDSIIDILFTGRAGVFAVTSSLIKAVIDGPVSSGVAPGRIEFHTADLLGTVSSKMVLKNDGKLQVNHIESLGDGLTIVGDITGSVFTDNSTRIIDGTEGGKITTPSITLSDFLQLPVYADDAERSASVPSPTIGMVIFIEVGTTPAASNQPQYFNGSSWTNI